MRIVLVGMRGAGKSTVGRRLAQRLTLSFSDCDDLVADNVGLPVPEIFARRGEPFFRRVEAEIAAELLTRDQQIVALGGGALMTPSVAERVRREPLSIWLDAPVAVLSERVAKSDRPRLTGLPLAEEMATLVAVRRPVYEACARVRLTTDDHDVDETCHVIEQLWRDLSSNDLR